MKHSDILQYPKTFFPCLNQKRAPGSKGPSGPYLTAPPPLLFFAWVFHSAPTPELTPPGGPGDVGDMRLVDIGAYAVDLSDNWNRGGYVFGVGGLRGNDGGSSNPFSNIASSSLLPTTFAPIN